jgi:hypothetical protein
MLSHTSAEWHVIPADHKRFSRLSTSAVLVETLRNLNPQYPQVTAAAKAELAEAGKESLGGAMTRPHRHRHDQRGFTRTRVDAQQQQR